MFGILHDTFLAFEMPIDLNLLARHSMLIVIHRTNAVCTNLEQLAGWRIILPSLINGLLRGAVLTGAAPREHQMFGLTGNVI